MEAKCGLMGARGLGCIGGGWDGVGDAFPGLVSLFGATGGQFGANFLVFPIIGGSPLAPWPWPIVPLKALWLAYYPFKSPMA